MAINPVNPSDSETFETVPQMFHNTVRQHNNRVALRVKEFGLWHDITWAAYYEKVSSIGSALASLGLEPKQSVCIIGDNSLEWVVADLATQCIGGVCVGIYATNAWQQVEYVVDHSDARFLFVENEEQLDKWLMFRDNTSRLEKVIIWDTKGLSAYKDPDVMTFQELMDMGEKIKAEQPELFKSRMEKVVPDDLSVIIYTSGTTGRPKGAMLSHKSVTWMPAAVAANKFEIKETDNVLSFLPLCHIFERLFSVFIHLRFAYTVNFVEKAGYGYGKHEGSVTNHWIRSTQNLGKVLFQYHDQDVGCRLAETAGIRPCHERG
jgi:long-chain acyl-CoA synthetase